MKIEKFSERYLDGVVDLYIEVFAEPPWNEKWEREEVIEDITNAMKKEQGIVLVAVNNDNVVGFAWGYIDLEKAREAGLQGKWFYLDDIGVKKEYRRRGIATMLIKELENYAKKYCKGIFFRTNEKNTSMIKLAEKLKYGKLEYKELVKKERINGNVEGDVRIYFAKVL